MSETVTCWVVRNADGRLEKPWYWGQYPAEFEDEPDFDIIVWSWQCDPLSQSGVVTCEACGATNDERVVGAHHQCRNCGRPLSTD